jgi:hypothetical protein
MRLFPTPHQELFILCTVPGDADWAATCGSNKVCRQASSTLPDHCSEVQIAMYAADTTSMRMGSFKDANMYACEADTTRPALLASNIPRAIDVTMASFLRR